MNTIILLIIIGVSIFLVDAVNCIKSRFDCKSERYKRLEEHLKKYRK
jgi:hypothetical protein